MLSRDLLDMPKPKGCRPKGMGIKLLLSQWQIPSAYVIIDSYIATTFSTLINISQT